MTALARHNATHPETPWCPCCSDRDVRLAPVGPGVWSCPGCRGELGFEPCWTVGTPIEGQCSPDGEHYHFTTTHGVADAPEVLA